MDERSSNDFLLSIIIPVYNIDQYISDCLHSLTLCDLNGCEILISVGDSQDASNQICESFARCHNFARVILQSGKGLSNARNCAMLQAKGKYILFIDGDDTVEFNQLNGLICKIRDGTYHSDVIVTDYRYFDYRFHAWRYVNQIGENTPDQYDVSFFPVMLKKRGGFWNVWRYVYKRSFLEKNDISFLENMMSEDMDFTARVWGSNPTVIFTHCPFYQYAVGRGTSLMDRPTLARLADTARVIQISCDNLRKSNFAYADLLRDRYQYEYILMLALIFEFDASNRKNAAQIFQNWKEVLKNSKDFFVRCACVLLHLIGVKGTAYILSLVKALRHRKLERSLRK